MKRLVTIGALAAAVTALVAPAATGAATQSVRVSATSYKLTLSARPKAGLVRFVVRNVSHGDAHDFWLRGGGKTVHTRVLTEGQSQTLTVRLKRGVLYRIWCGVGDHAEDGMRASFRAR